MVPNRIVADPSASPLIESVAYWVGGIYSDAEVAAVSGIPADVLLGQLQDPAFQQAVDAAMRNLKNEGKLSNARAEHLLLKSLERIDEGLGEASLPTAIKVAELGLKFRERQEVSKAPAAKAQIVILKPGDPDYVTPDDGGHHLIIDLRGPKRPVIEGEIVSGKGGE